MTQKFNKLTSAKMRLLQKNFCDLYDELRYAYGGNQCYVDKFDELLNNNSFKENILFPFNEWRNDIITSNGEAIVFIVACIESGIIPDCK